VHSSSGPGLDAALGLPGNSVANVVVSVLGSAYGRSEGKLRRPCAQAEPVEVVCSAPRRGDTLDEACPFGELASVCSTA